VERRVERAGRDVWAALARATPAIVHTLASEGVIGAEFVVGFVLPLDVYVWLVTATDAERDALGSSNPFLAEVTSAILTSGFPVEHAAIAGTVAQSQETVDRDYEGSWFYALR
jgi:hypothetical protein